MLKTISNNLDKKIISFNLYNKYKPLEYNVPLYLGSIFVGGKQSRVFTPVNIYDNNNISYENKYELGKNLYDNPFILNFNNVLSFFNYKNIHTKEDYLPTDYLIFSNMIYKQEDSYIESNYNILHETHIKGLTTTITYQAPKYIQNDYTNMQIFSKYFETGLFNELNEFCVTFLYPVQEQYYGVIHEVYYYDYRNHYYNCQHPHYTSILDNFILIKDNKLKDNPFNDTSVTFYVEIFNDITITFTAPYEIEDLYFILKYSDNTVTLECYDVSVDRIYDSTANKHYINYNLTKPLDFTGTLSKDINELVDISKARINIPSKITNVRFMPIIMDDYFLKDFDTMKADGMQYHF